MKNRTLLLTAAIVIIMLAGCKKEDTEPSSYLTVSTMKLDFKAEGETKSLILTANKCWTIKGIPSWLNVTEMTGNVKVNTLVNSFITVSTTEANTTTAERSAKLFIILDGEAPDLYITVSQAAAEGLQFQ